MCNVCPRLIEAIIFGGCAKGEVLILIFIFCVCEIDIYSTVSSLVFLMLAHMCILSLLLLVTSHISILLSNEWALYNSNKNCQLFIFFGGPPPALLISDPASVKSSRLEEWGTMSRHDSKQPIVQQTIFFSTSCLYRMPAYTAMLA